MTSDMKIYELEYWHHLMVWIQLVRIMITGDKVGQQ